MASTCEVSLRITLVASTAEPNLYFRASLLGKHHFLSPSVSSAVEWLDAVNTAVEGTETAGAQAAEAKGKAGSAKAKGSAKNKNREKPNTSEAADGDEFVPRLMQWTSQPISLDRSADTALALAAAPRLLLFAGTAQSKADASGVSGEQYRWHCPLDASPLLDSSSPVTVACGSAVPPAMCLQHPPPEPAQGGDDTETASVQAGITYPLPLKAMGLPDPPFMYLAPPGVATCIIQLIPSCPLLTQELRSELNPLTVTLGNSLHLPGVHLPTATAAQRAELLQPTRYSHLQRHCAPPYAMARLFGPTMPALDRVVLTPQLQWSALTDASGAAGDALSDSDSSSDEEEGGLRATQGAKSFPRISWNISSTVLLGAVPVTDVREALLTRPLVLRLHDRDAGDDIIATGAVRTPASRQTSQADVQGHLRDDCDGFSAPTAPAADGAGAPEGAAGTTQAPSRAQIATAALAAAALCDISGTGVSGAETSAERAKRWGAIAAGQRTHPHAGAMSAPADTRPDSKSSGRGGRSSRGEGSPAEVSLPPAVQLPAGMQLTALLAADGHAGWEVEAQAVMSSGLHPHAVGCIQPAELLNTSAVTQTALAGRTLGATKGRHRELRQQLSSTASAAVARKAAQLACLRGEKVPAAVPAPEAGGGGQLAEDDSSDSDGELLLKSTLQRGQALLAGGANQEDAAVRSYAIVHKCSVNVLPRKRQALPRGGEDSALLTPQQQLVRDTGAYVDTDCRMQVTFALALPLVPQALSPNEASGTQAEALLNTGSDADRFGRMVLVTRYKDDSLLVAVNAFMEQWNKGHLEAFLVEAKAAKRAAAAEAAAAAATAAAEKKSPRGRKKSGKDSKAASAAQGTAPAPQLPDGEEAVRAGLTGTRVDSVSALELTPGEVWALQQGVLDLVTGWQVVDKAWRVIVVEGGAQGSLSAIPALSAHLARNFRNSEKRKLLDNPAVRWAHREYAHLNLTLHTTHLARRLAKIVEMPVTYSANPAKGSAPANEAAHKIFELRRVQRLWDSKRAGLFPTAAQLVALGMREGDTVTHVDMYGADAAAARAFRPTAAPTGEPARAGMDSTALSSAFDSSTVGGSGTVRRLSSRMDGNSTVAGEGLESTEPSDVTPSGRQRSYRKGATDSSFPGYAAVKSALATSRGTTDFVNRNAAAVHELSGALTSALQQQGVSYEQRRALPQSVLDAQAAGHSMHVYSGQTHSITEAQRAEQRARLQAAPGRTYVVADSAEGGLLLSATASPWDLKELAAAEAAASAAANTTKRGWTSPSTRSMVERQRHAKAPDAATMQMIREPYLEQAEAAALQREEERAAAAAASGQGKQWLPVAACGRDFGYTDPNTGADASAAFNGGLREPPAANAQEAAARQAAEAQHWRSKLVVDEAQVKWRGHGGSHAAPGTMDKYKSMLRDPPATRALKAMHATQLADGRIVPLQQDGLAVDTVHRDAAPGQAVPGAMVQREPLPAPTGGGGSPRPLGVSASFGALASSAGAGIQSSGTLNTAQGGYGKGPIQRAAKTALSAGGTLPLPLSASASAGTVSSQHGYSRKGAWAAGILQNPQTSTATGLLPRTPVGAARAAFQPHPKRDMRYKRAGMPALSAQERVGPKW